MLALTLACSGTQCPRQQTGHPSEFLANGASEYPQITSTRPGTTKLTTTAHLLTCPLPGTSARARQLRWAPAAGHRTLVSTNCPPTQAGSPTAAQTPERRMAHHTLLGAGVGDGVVQKRHQKSWSLSDPRAREGGMGLGRPRSSGHSQLRRPSTMPSAPS